MAGTIIIILGVLFLLGNIFPEAHLWRFVGNLWPVLLIILGLYIVGLRPRFHRRKGGRYHDHLIGETRLQFRGKEIDGLDISHLIGELDIDLTGARLKDGENTMHISQSIGETRIIVPLEFPLRLSGDLLLGELSSTSRKEQGIHPVYENADDSYETSTQKLHIIFTGAIGGFKLQRI